MTRNFDAAPERRSRFVTCCTIAFGETRLGCELSLIFICVRVHLRLRACVSFRVALLYANAFFFFFAFFAIILCTFLFLMSLFALASFSTAFRSLLIFFSLTSYAVCC